MSRNSSNYPANTSENFRENRPCTPHLSTTIAKRLEKALRDTIDPLESLESIDETIDKTMNVLTGFLQRYPQRHQQIFNEVCNFFNNLFASCHLRNFYNSAPNVRLDIYNESSLWDQLVNNIYPRSEDEELFLNANMNGASCHYRSVFMKNIFDRLQEAGLPIESYIYMFNEGTNRHSGVILKHRRPDGEMENFVVDTWWINKVHKKLILTIDPSVTRFTDESWASLQEILQKKSQRDDCFFFDATKDFINQVHRKQSLAILLEFHSPLAWESNISIGIKITPDSIYLEKGWEKRELPYSKEAYSLAKKNFDKNLDFENEDPLLWALFSSIAFPNDEVKKTWEPYFSLLKNKISPRRLDFVASYTQE